jgi:hypothetical protein
MDVHLILFVVHLCVLTVGLRLIAGISVNYNENYWRKFRSSNRKLYDDLFPRAYVREQLEELAHEERYWRRLLMFLGTIEALTPILLRLFPVPMGLPQSVLTFVLAPMCTAMVLSHWYRLDWTHSTVAGARHFLQSKGLISQDPP